MNLFGEADACDHSQGTGLFLHGKHVGEHCLVCGQQLPRGGVFLTHAQAHPALLIQWNERQEWLVKELETL